MIFSPLIFPTSNWLLIHFDVKQLSDGIPCHKIWERNHLSGNLKWDSGNSYWIGGMPISTKKLIIWLSDSIEKESDCCYCCWWPIGLDRRDRVMHQFLSPDYFMCFKLITHCNIPVSWTVLECFWHYLCNLYYLSDLYGKYTEQNQNMPITMVHENVCIDLTKDMDPSKKLGNPILWV